MSRPEAVAKAGYYPTPPSVVERVAALIRPTHPTNRQAVRLLDPCCGTGAALRQLANAVGGETYGMEIARDRWQEAEAQSGIPGGASRISQTTRGTVRSRPRTLVVATKPAAG